MMVSYAHDISDWQVSVIEGYISACAVKWVLVFLQYSVDLQNVEFVKVVNRI